MENVNISKSEYVELLRYKEMIQVLEQLMHEPAFKQEFISRILDAEKRVKEGEKRSFKSVKEMSAYLDQIKDE